MTELITRYRMVFSTAVYSGQAIWNPLVRAHGPSSRLSRTASKTPLWTNVRRPCYDVSSILTCFFTVFLAPTLGRERHKGRQAEDVVPKHSDQAKPLRNLLAENEEVPTACDAEVELPKKGERIIRNM